MDGVTKGFGLDGENQRAMNLKHVQSSYQVMLVSNAGSSIFTANLLSSLLSRHLFI